MKIGIIGGGASGVIAAIKAKDKGADVVIFEKEDRILTITVDQRYDLSDMDRVVAAIKEKD